MGSNINERNGQWKGDDVGYDALHVWVRRRVAKPDLCVMCKISPPRDLANISQEYRRDLSDWEWLCRSCHMTKDSRARRLTAYSKARASEAKIISCLFCGNEKRVQRARKEVAKYCSYQCSVDHRRRNMDMSPSAVRHREQTKRWRLLKKSEAEAEREEV